MSEYDHMMRGGKTGSGPMADHIQARALCFFAFHVVVIVAAIVYLKSTLLLLRVSSQVPLSQMSIEGSVCASENFFYR
jgi:hypothetical protein